MKDNHIDIKLTKTPDGFEKMHFAYIDEDSIKIYTIVFTKSAIYSIVENRVELGDFYKVKDEIILECIPIEMNSNHEVYRALINHRRSILNIKHKKSLNLNSDLKLFLII